MTLADLFAKALGSSVDRRGIDLMRDRLSEGACRGLAEVTLGKLVLLLGQVVAGNPLLAMSAAQHQRKTRLAEAFREMATLCAIYGITADNISESLETGG